VTKETLDNWMDFKGVRTLGSLKVYLNAIQCPYYEQGQTIWFDVDGVITETVDDSGTCYSTDDTIVGFQSVVYETMVEEFEASLVRTELLNKWLTEQEHKNE